MKKLLVLIKKEVQELLTPQMLVPLFAVVLVFFFIGKIIGKETAKTQAAQPIEVLNLDNSAISNELIQTLEQNGLKPNVTNQGNAQQTIELAKQKNEKAVLVIPKGFGSGIDNLTPLKIEAYTILKNFSIAGSLRSDATFRAGLAAANERISNQLLLKANAEINPIILKQPVIISDFVVVANKQANVSPSAVAGFISSQTTFIPIILFLVIILASQLIAVSIASEKENKTLETLLSSPVNRQFIIASKLLGAGIVSLLSAAVYMIGMRNYVNGLTASTAQIGSDAATRAVMIQLGLTFSIGDYILLGLSLFFGILSALSVAIILGSFAENTQSAQGVIAPLMILILIPYFLTIFLDISTLPTFLRWFVYAIPFSHPFLAAPNILLGQYHNVWYGILYMAIFFLIFVYVASRIFATDKIFTMKISLKRK